MHKESIRSHTCLPWAAEFRTHRALQSNVSGKRSGKNVIWPTLTATSRSAESNISTGALPPSSRQTRFTVEADCDSRSWITVLRNTLSTQRKTSPTFPTAVLPVKLIASTSVLSQTYFEISAVCFRSAGKTLNTPGGIPASSAVLKPFVWIEGHSSRKNE